MKPIEAIEFNIGDFCPALKRLKVAPELGASITLYGEDNFSDLVGQCKTGGEFPVVGFTEDDKVDWYKDEKADFTVECAGCKHLTKGFTATTTRKIQE